MLCFNKLTGENNAKNTLKIFVLWEYNFKDDVKKSMSDKKLNYLSFGEASRKFL